MVGTTQQASTLYATGLREGWMAVNASSGVVLADDMCPSENAAMLSRWREALQNTVGDSADCLLVTASPLVSSLLQQHSEADSDIVYLNRRRGQNSALPIFADAQAAIAFRSDATRMSAAPSQFLLRQERALCLINSSPRFLQNLARDTDARIFRYLATLLGQSSSVTAATPSPAIMMPPHIGNGALTPGTIWTTHSVQQSHSSLVPTSPIPPPYPYANSEDDYAAEIMAEKPVLPTPVITDDPITGEKTLQSDRRVRYLAPLITGIGLGLNMFMMSGFIGKVVIETLVDGNYARFAFLIMIPFFMMISQFLWENLTACLAQIFFPIRQMHENSLYYSGEASEPLPPDHTLPQFTINMPCYKEGLSSVLAPSLESAMDAVRAYRALGGIANVVVSEDGLRLLSREEAEERIRYYNSMGVGWVARPRHSSEPGGYFRKGRFKKASNLNFTYNLSLRTEEIFEESSTDVDPEQRYVNSLAQAVKESDGQAWASGNIRIGDYILLIDSDTRMPVDCLIEAAAEMERCPEVGALQHCSGVMYVRNHYFERFIGYFTSACVNFSISWVCANGAMAPLMGHNVFLRWSAMQEVSNIDTDGERTFFSPHHVSEDFEMALKLQMKGYVIRWATYSNQGFTEGVSFTPEDETARFQKYAYGCSEIVFNPLRYWFTRGPLSKLFRTFIFSDVNTSYKIATLSYLSTYYALAISFPVTIVVFIAQGLFLPYLDPIFLPSFDVMITVMLVFTLAGGLGLVTARARCGHATFGRAAMQALGHGPAMAVFFSGLAFHVMTALLAHMFGYNMTWGSTNKDFTETSLRQVLRRYWLVYVVMGTSLAGLAIASSPLIPLKWRTESYQLLIPPILLFCFHIIFPVVLDPGVLHKYLPDIGQNEFALKFKSKQEAFFYNAGQQVKRNYITHFTTSESRGALRLADESGSEKDSVSSSSASVASAPTDSQMRAYPRVL